MYVRHVFNLSQSKDCLNKKICFCKYLKTKKSTYTFPIGLSICVTNVNILVFPKATAVELFTHQLHQEILWKNNQVVLFYFYLSCMPLYSKTN